MKPKNYSEYRNKLCVSILLYLISFLLYPTNSKSQSFCKTAADANSPGILPQGSGLSPGPFTLKVYLHIIRRSDGSGGISISELEESKSYLDYAFAQHNIFFAYACDFAYIDNTIIYNYPWIHLCDLQSISSHPDGLDVFIGGDDSAAGGDAGVMLSYGFVVGGTFFGSVFSRSHVISHEMGHCLGLWHTHHGTYNESGEDCNGINVTDPNQCAECMDGSNSDVCGDYVADTPADNNIGQRVSPSCMFLGADLDACTNTFYDPPVNNIMSYSTPGCMTQFTNKQGDRMRSLIVLDAGLSARLLPIPANSVIHIYGIETLDISQTMPGDIMVHTGAELLIANCTIKMPWKSKIVVERGAVLLTSNAILTRACGAPDWQGIHVEGNSSIEQPEIYDIPGANQAGIILITNNSTVEWARTAISTSRPGAYFGDYFGGLVYASNSQFLYNRRVAEFMKYDFENKSVFNNCTMDGFNRYNSIGVTIWDCDKIQFISNDIHNMKIGGIYAIDGSAIVRDANHFNNCGNGIYTMATYPASGTMHVEGIGSNNKNTFENNMIHIRANNTGPHNSLFIQNNEFYQSRTRGIEIVGPSFYYINENNFTSHPVGVFVSDGGSLGFFVHSFIWKNYFSNSLYGINGQSENSQMQFLCNTFSCKYDFYNVRGASPARIYDFQGTALSPPNNCFSTHSSNLFDIHSRGDALWFTYYSYVDICKEPTTSGNYTNENTEENFNCYRIDNFTNPLTSTELYAIRDLIDLIGEPQSVEMIDSLYWLKIKESYLSNHLINLAVEIENEELLDSVIMGFDTINRSMINYCYFVKNNLYAAASNYLAQLPDSFTFNEFKQLQMINLERLEYQNNFSLGSTDSIFIMDVAHSDSTNRGFARSMIYLLRGIEVQEPDVPEPEAIQEQGLEFRLKKEKKPALILVPDPANEVIKVINLKKDLNQINYRIFDINGRVLKTGELKLNLEADVYLNKFEGGIYFLNMCNAEMKINQTTRFVIYN